MDSADGPLDISEYLVISTLSTLTFGHIVTKHTNTPMILSYISNFPKLKIVSVLSVLFVIITLKTNT